MTRIKNPDHAIGIDNKSLYKDTIKLVAIT